jgi:hypothetical protein
MTDQELKDLVASLAVKSDRLDAAQLKTDAQLASYSAEIRAAQRNNEIGFAEIRAAQRNNEIGFAEVRAAQLKTEAAQRNNEIGFAEVRAAQLKTEALLDAVGARLDAVGIKLNQVAQMLGGVANSNGEVTEEFFFNSLKREPQIGSLHFDQVKSNVIVKESGEKKAELDIVLLNGQCAAVIEVKHRPQKKDIEQLLSAIASYKSSLPKDKQGKKYKIYGGIAGFSVPKSIVSLAKDNGLFVLKQSGLLISSQTEGMTAF